MRRQEGGLAKATWRGVHSTRCHLHAPSHVGTRGRRVRCHQTTCREEGVPAGGPREGEPWAGGVPAGGPREGEPRAGGASVTEGKGITEEKGVTGRRWPTARIGA